MHTFIQQNASSEELCSHCYYKPLVLLKLFAPVEIVNTPLKERFIFMSHHTSIFMGESCLKGPS